MEHIRGSRKLLTLTCQLLMVVFSFIMANTLFHDFTPPPEQLAMVLSLLLPLILIKLSSFALMNQLSGWWRYVSIHDVTTLVKANLLGTLLFACYLNYVFNGPIHLPAALLIIDLIICFLVMSGTRVIVRLVCEHFNLVKSGTSSVTEKILIVGAGAAGQSIAREIRQNPHQNRTVVGFVDQDLNRVNLWFEGLPVLATISRLKTVLQSKQINLVILANPALCHKELRKIVMICQECGVKSKILPNVEEILNDKVSIRHTRDVKLEDLLGRPQVHLDVPSIRSYLANKTILVTGAAGSIGSEICRRVADYGVTSVILFDNAETPLFNIQRELETGFPSVEFTPLLCDARNFSHVDYVFSHYRPDVVFHAAAYKHVPMSEYNPLIVLENNVIGSRNLIYAADRYKVNRFVMISTDKAVNPTNIMGASKRAAESYAQALARTSQTKYVTVRFGNVLGSNGSVVPIFQEQILSGGPVTVTDRRVTRFFMTIPEAVQLVMQAGSMGTGGEIFVLNMGEQIEIVHLAEELIRLSGMTPYEDIDIVFTGLRPGEKLHEELLHSHENIMKTSHDKIFIAQSYWIDLETLNSLLDKLAIACGAMNREQAMEIISSIVPEFSPVWCSLTQEANHFKPQQSSKVIRFPLKAADAETV